MVVFVKRFCVYIQKREQARVGLAGCLFTDDLNFFFSEGTHDFEPAIFHPQRITDHHGCVGKEIPADIAAADLAKAVPGPALFPA